MHNMQYKETRLNHKKITISEERRIGKLRKKGTISIKKTDKGGVNCLMSLCFYGD